MLYMLPKPQIQNGIDITNLSAGIYFLQMTDERTKKVKHC
ncbi:MAG: T9SS type A sorting domain-containing protein [Ignavibacteria bacterium]|nr:T9SS type A sorting domain-containing protein [Ignavibacteria bacterium]